MKTPATVLLVVIAALLAVNLIVNLPPQEAQAQAQPPWLPPVDDAPTVVGVAAFNRPAGGGLQVPHIYRIWSDGTVEENRRTCSGFAGGTEGHLNDWCGWTTVPE